MMPTIRSNRGKALAGIGLAGAVGASLLVTAGASSHREAPLLTEDPVADNTDLYAFNTPGDTVTLVGNWIPMEEPASGPNFHKFGDDVLYEFNIDNDADAVDDIVYEFRFRTQVQNGDTFLYNTGPIGSLTDPDFNIRQTYTVTEVRDGVRTVLGRDIPTPPVNVGTRSFEGTSYDAVADQAIRDLGNGIKVFAGQREDSFFTDIGSIFDVLGLRPLNEAHAIPRPAEPGIDTFAGYNTHSIAIQVPKARLTSGDEPVIGVYSTTYRRKVRVFQRNDGADLAHNGPWVQVSRLGNPLVNEVVIPLKDKDRFNASKPADDGQFLDYVLRPELDTLIPALYAEGGNVTCYPTGDRTDLVAVFLTGLEIPGLIDTKPDNADAVPSEQLRLNTDSGLDNAWPNGRSLDDDITDTALRAVAGAALPIQECAGESPNQDLTDGVQENDVAFRTTFPYVQTPFSGYLSDENDDR